jgi:hypothetical protein
MNTYMYIDRHRYEIEACDDSELDDDVSCDDSELDDDVSCDDSELDQRFKDER